MSKLILDAAKRREELLKITVDQVGEDRSGMGDDSKFHLETVSIDKAVGVPGIDKILGGGWRRGRFALVIGETSMGKTLLTQWTIIAFQQAGYQCGFIDPEKTYDEEWFTKTGINCKELIVARPPSSEGAFDLACAWADAEMDLIVLDSLAALTPQAQMEYDMADKKFMGDAAKLMSEGLRKLTNVNKNSFILCTNQLRKKIGITYGDPTVIPGGEAQRYYASYIVTVSRGSWITDGPGKDAPKIGYEMKLTTRKSKLTQPFQTAMVPFLFSGVTDGAGGTVDMAIELDIIEKHGAMYTLPGVEKAIRGLAAVKAHMSDHPSSLEAVKVLIAQGDGTVEFD